MSTESVTVRESSDVKIVDVNGDLVGPMLSAFRETLVELADTGAEKIVVNLSRVKHINSLSIGAIIHIAKRLRQKSGDLKAYGLTAYIRGIFDLIGTSEVIEIYDSERGALDAFK